MPLTLLKKYFGYDKFRPAQAEIIDSILSSHDTLGILPTGGGKSLCYQIPALKMPGMCLVISPLISLMKDQVDALRENGVGAAYINSSQSAPEQREVIQGMLSGEFKLVYVAPERVQAPSFTAILSRIQVSQVAIDEAHCISQWGHDFRPSYQAIPMMIKTIGTRPVITAFTATATPEVKQDILARLHIPQAKVFVQGFDRPNLTLSVYRDEDKSRFIMDYWRSHKGQSGIIYANTRKTVEEIYGRMNQSGVKVGYYHAGMDDASRKQMQEDFIYDKLDIMVATNAFGMGIDKSNVRFVIHNNMPKDIESYYQEAGRAGRDGADAECILLYQGNDLYLQRYFLDQARDQLPPDVLKKREEKLQEMVNYCHSQDCLRTIILSYFGERMEGAACENCSNCQDFEWEDVTEVSRLILGVTIQIKAGATTVGDILKGSLNQKIKRNGWDELSGHGTMKRYSKEEIRKLINNLLSAQHIGVSPGQFPVLFVTNKGRELLKSGQKIEIKKFVTARESKKEPREDRNLFDKLSHLRLTLSRTEKVPPYIIFSDKTLQEMAQYRPLNRQDLYQISGVGEKKIEQYGDLFLAVLQDYCESHNLSGGALPSKRKKEASDSLSTKMLEYHEKHLSGMLPEDIAQEMDVQPATVINNLLRCARQGKKLDYSLLLEESCEQQVLSVIEKKGKNLLKPIKENLPEDISYDTIRLVIQKNFS